MLFKVLPMIKGKSSTHEHISHTSKVRLFFQSRIQLFEACQDRIIKPLIFVVRYLFSFGDGGKSRDIIPYEEPIGFVGVASHVRSSNHG